MDRIKQELRLLLRETLTMVQKEPVANRQQFVRKKLEYIQGHCQRANKKFIVCELGITCDQYGLGGSEHHCAVLFRGPSEDASVAICVTDRGSVLYRSGSPWQLIYSARDVRPARDIRPARERVLASTGI